MEPRRWLFNKHLLVALLHFGDLLCGKMLWQLRFTSAVNLNQCNTFFLFFARVGHYARCLEVRNKNIGEDCAF